MNGILGVYHEVIRVRAQVVRENPGEGGTSTGERQGGSGGLGPCATVLESHGGRQLIDYVG